MTKEAFIAQMNEVFNEDVAGVMQNGDVLLQYPTDADYLIEEQDLEHPDITKEQCEDGYTEMVIPSKYFDN